MPTGNDPAATALAATRPANAAPSRNHPAAKDLATEAADLCDLLDENNLTRLDFDDLRLWLTHAAEHLSATTTIAAQPASPDTAATSPQSATLTSSSAESASRDAALRDVALRDLTLLRDDYRARIAGMLKAITISERSKLTLESLADLISSLSAMSAEDLIGCYRRTSALFRDHFPTTLSLPGAKTL